MTALFLITVLLIAAATAAQPTATAVTLPLTPIRPTTSPPLNIYQHLNRLAAASISRANFLKQPNAAVKATAPSAAAVPLSPHSYGGYSVPLGFGTPPQKLPLIVDTGSDMVWFPCSRNYVCRNCSAPKLQSFIPNVSSTLKILGCKDPKCGWAHHDPDPKSRCRACPTGGPANCTCPPYIIQYGSGVTAGLPVLETLDLGHRKRVPEFLAGCSLLSVGLPAGIAGFGRGPNSLPSQLGLTKFSFCLVSHRFDESRKSSTLDMVVAGKDARKKTAGVVYIPFLKNPIVHGESRFSVYYYLGLRRVSVGGKHVKIPHRYLSPPDPKTGSGGTVVDSGTTLTYMEEGIFRPVAEEFESQMRNFSRDRKAEELTGLQRCFDVSEAKKVSFPTLTFHFKGGGEMVLPVENYMALAGKRAACLTIVAGGGGAEEGGGGGPNVILGNFQMQNFYVEYDLKRGRFGFKRQKC